jgi:hypothetical protein
VKEGKCPKSCKEHTTWEHDAWARGYKRGRQGEKNFRNPYGKKDPGRRHWIAGHAVGFRKFSEENPPIPFEVGHWVVTELESMPISSGKVLDVRTVPQGIFVKVRKRYGRRCDWSEWYPANELRNLGAREDLDKAYG